MKLAGAAYLVWLGVKLWRRSARITEVVELAAVAFLPLRREALVGIAMALGNPVAVVFYVASLPTFLDVGAVTPAGYAVLCGIVAAVSTAIMAAYALFAGGLPRVFRAALARRAMDRTAGTVMIGAGLAAVARQGPSRLLDMEKNSDPALQRVSSSLPDGSAAIPARQGRTGATGLLHDPIFCLGDRVASPGQGRRDGVGACDIRHLERRPIA